VIVIEGVRTVDHRPDEIDVIAIGDKLTPQRFSIACVAVGR
jgi:hypothetical protein